MAAGPGVFREGNTLRVLRTPPDAAGARHAPEAPRSGQATPEGRAPRVPRFVPVSLSLYAGLGRYAPAPGPLAVEVEDGLTVGELLGALGLPPGEVKLVFVNHRAAEPGHILGSGDRVGAFPLIAGG